MKGIRRYYRVHHNGDYYQVQKYHCFFGWRNVGAICYGNAMTARKCWRAYKLDRKNTGMYNVRGKKEQNQ